MPACTDTAHETVTVHCECPGYCPLSVSIDRQQHQDIKSRGYAIVAKICTNPRARGDVLVVDNDSYRLYWTSEK